MLSTTVTGVFAPVNIYLEIDDGSTRRPSKGRIRANFVAKQERDNSISQERGRWCWGDSAWISVPRRLVEEEEHYD